MKKPLVHVALALVVRAERWLVARRHAHVHLGGLWEFPGGKLHIGETPVEAALRELREECGLCGVAVRELPHIIAEYADRRVCLMPVLCRCDVGEAQPLAAAATRWVTRDELRRLEMPEANRELIAVALAAADAARLP